MKAVCACSDDAAVHDIMSIEVSNILRSLASMCPD